MYIIKPIFEFILWDNCKNNCKFCWQKKHYCNLSTNDKKLAINAVDEFIASNQYENASHVMLVGGEIFDNIDIKDEFLVFTDKLLKKMKAGIVDLFYINTNLLNTNIEFLFEFLDKIAVYDLFDRLKFTTSYDIYGRFKDDITVELWKSNLSQCILRYPKLNIVINTIMTKLFCNKEKHELVPFVKRVNDKFGCYVNLLPYIAVDSELTPSRNDVFSILKQTDNAIPYLAKYILNFDLPQKKLIYRYVDGKLKFSSSLFNICGHGINFTKYSNKNTCFICDIKELFQ